LDLLLKNCEIPRLHKILIAILLLGLVFRIIFLIEFRSTPFYRHPTLDAKYYDQLAGSVASGKLAQDRAFFMGPLYPYSMGLLYFVFGHHYIIPRIAQMLLGLACCLFVYRLGRALFASAVGLVAAGIYAIYKPVLFYEQTLLSETPMALTCVILLYVVAAQRQKSRLLSWFLIGTLLGINALLRGNVLLFAPVLMIWILVCEYRDNRHSFVLTSLKKILTFLLGLSISILPVTLHNYAAEKDFVLISSNAGFNFYIGNHEGATGLFEIPPLVDMDQDPSGSRVAEADQGRYPLKSSEVSSYWSSRAVKFIRQNPGDFIRLLVKKLYFFWGQTEIAQIYSMNLMKGFMPILTWPLPGFYIIGPLSLMGMGLCLFKPDRRKILIVLFVHIYVLSFLPFFLTARYRIPVIPVLCIFSSVAIVHLGGIIYKKRLKEAAIFFSGLILLFVILDNTRFFSSRDEASQFHNALGLMYKSEGKGDEAVREFHNALIAKSSSYAYANLATYYYENKDYDQANGYYQEAIRLEPYNARMYFNAGQAFLAAQKFDEARTSFEKATTLDSRVHPLAHYNLAILYIRKKEESKARKALETYFEMCPRDLEARRFFHALLKK